MNEVSDERQAGSLTHERHAWRARFLTRFNRYKSQLTKGWWILLTSMGLGLAAEATLWRFKTPVYVSCGRMIVNLKLSIPEGSLYTEELNNFLGTQAALMQSGVVINRAREQVAQRLANLDSQPIALKVSSSPGHHFCPSGHRRQQPLHPGICPSLHGGIYYAEKGNACPDLGHDIGRND